MTITYDDQGFYHLPRFCSHCLEMMEQLNTEWNNTRGITFEGRVFKDLDFLLMNIKFTENIGSMKFERSYSINLDKFKDHNVISARNNLEKILKDYFKDFLLKMDESII